MYIMKSKLPKRDSNNSNINSGSEESGSFAYRVPTSGDDSPGLGVKVGYRTVEEWSGRDRLAPMPLSGGGQTLLLQVQEGIGCAWMVRASEGGGVSYDLLFQSEVQSELSGEDVDMIHMSAVVQALARTFGEKVPE